MGVAYFNSATFNIDAFVWAENLPGAAFAPPDRIMHVTLYCGVSPYIRGTKS
jgi:hypothetical protein